MFRKKRGDKNFTDQMVRKQGDGKHFSDSMIMKRGEKLLAAMLLGEEVIKKF
jgi:hypothetical protein